MPVYPYSYRREISAPISFPPAPSAGLAPVAYSAKRRGYRPEPSAPLIVNPGPTRADFLERLHQIAAAADVIAAS